MIDVWDDLEQGRSCWASFLAPQMRRPERLWLGGPWGSLHALHALLW